MEGKGKAASGSKDGFLKIPDLTPMDPLKQSEVYTSIQGTSGISKGESSKKHQDDSGKTQPKRGVGRPKRKSIQTAKYQENNFIAPLSTASRSHKRDAPDPFWASFEPYFADTTTEDVKFLEDFVQVHEADEEYFKIPLLGKHYSFEWASGIIREEQKIGMKANEEMKDVNNSCLLNSIDPELFLKKADKNNYEDNLAHGSLAHRLMNCLIEEKIMPSLEDTIDTTKEIPDPEDGDGKNSDDTVLAELKETQATLKLITEHNIVQKNRLLELAKEEVARQVVVKKLQLLDSQIMNIFRGRKETTLSNTEREQTVEKLKERKSLVQQLETIENISL